MIKLKRDKYRQARGGNSRLLEVRCGKCDALVCLYQKDGPGILKRLYLDRIDSQTKQEKLLCPKCKELLGVYFIYKKENRPAYRLFAGAVTKRIIPVT
jgi:phage FluMu protein Com